VGKIKELALSGGGGGERKGGAVAAVVEEKKQVERRKVDMGACTDMFGGDEGGKE